MNLLIYVPQMAAFGGIERHIVDLSLLLAGRGHRVRLLTTSNSLSPAFRHPLTDGGVEVRELPRPRGQAGPVRKSFWLAREALRPERIRWDVIYTNGQSGLARLVWLAARAGTRVVHQHHNAADALEQQTWSPSFRRVLQRAPDLLSCSEAARDELQRALGRTDVQCLPVLTAEILSAAEVTERTPAPDGRLHFGFVGRLVREKGIATICALSRRPELAHITWHLHGAGPDFPATFFSDYPNIAYHGAFAGNVQHAQILRQLDALVLFSTHSEARPMCLTEAMSAGLPWIATDRGGAPELAASPANAVIVPATGSLAVFAAAVSEMSARIQRGGTSRCGQRATYDRLFSPAVVADSWCRYFVAQKARSAA